LRNKTDGELEEVAMSKAMTNADKEPDWVNSANDRKRPFSEEEIDRFVEDYILGLDAHEWAELKSKYGEHEARKRIRASMVKMDENNLANMTPKGLVN